MTVQTPAVGGPSLPQERRLVTEIPGPASKELLERRQRSVARGLSHVLPVFVTAAGGGVIVDADGNSLIDFGSGIAVTGVGNSAERVVQRVTEQVARFTHTCFMVAPYEGYVEVCEELNRLTPGDHDKRSALFNSGAEAVENAVKIARYATGRPAIVTFDHAYHGRTNLTMALTAKNMPYKHRFGPFAGEVYRVPMAYPLRWPGGPERCREDALTTVKSLIHTQVGEENTAAIIIEPIQGEGGFIVPPDGFLPGLAEFCREHGIVLIADEIQSGLCRTGDWFGVDHEQVVPDLVTTAKGIADGLPLAGVTGRAELMDTVHPGGLGGTYGGNPIACAAALAVLDLFESERLLDRAYAQGEMLRDRLDKLAARLPRIGEVRGLGSMLGLEIVEDAATRQPSPARTRRILEVARERGLLLLRAGTHDNVIRLLPPLIATEEELERGVEILATALDDALGGEP
jgi:4-aminobutyrate aminotransferase / (S)-3-amino-2-methylpropionate transaminase / 5-aminovalerate transaminase